MQRTKKKKNWPDLIDDLMEILVWKLLGLLIKAEYKQMDHKLALNGIHTLLQFRMSANPLALGANHIL